MSAANHGQIPYWHGVFFGVAVNEQLAALNLVTPVEQHRGQIPTAVGADTNDNILFTPFAEQPLNHRGFEGAVGVEQQAPVLNGTAGIQQLRYKVQVMQMGVNRRCR